MTDKQQALDAALAQIDAHFGKGPDTSERRKLRAKHRLGLLLPALEGARKAAEADKARDPGECPEIEIDPFSAYAVGWFLRREAGTDEAISREGVPEALEDAARHIESGEVFGDAGEMLADLEAEIAHASYLAEHGVDPPAPAPPVQTVPYVYPAEPPF